MNPFRLAWVHFRITAMNEMQYRANFFVQIFQSGLALVTGLVAIGLVFTHTESLAGWSEAELLIVMGVHISLGGVINSWIRPNMQKLMEDIQQGNLDFALTKPADAQVYVSVREFRIWQLVDVLMGAVVIVWGVSRLTTSVSLGASLLFLAIVMLGAVMVYCVWLIVTTIAFRIIRADPINELFQGFYQAGRWPVSIYPGWLRGALTYVIPLAFAITLPAEALSDRLSGSALSVRLGLAIVMLIVARWVWRTNVKKYSGATA